MRGGLRTAILLATAIVLAAIWYFGTTTWRTHRQRREIAGLEPEVRLRLYESHMREFGHLCQPGTDLEEYCRNVAAVLDALPECDAACHDKIDPWIPSATR